LAISPEAPQVRTWGCFLIGGRSRCNAIRHGLTAETVIGALEDAEDYKAFEAAITADYDASSAVQRELTGAIQSGFLHAAQQ
jgi:hypothetical protein